MRRIDLLRVAGRVAGVLGAEDCVLVGGLAVGAHGYVRGTTDVDFVAKAALSEVRKRLVEDGIPAILKRGDALEGDFPCVTGIAKGVRIDVMPPLVPIEWEQAIEVSVGKRARLRVVDFVGLLRLKLRAGGPRDLMDVAALVLRHPEHQARAIEISQAYRLADKLEIWLKDPRLRAEVREANRALEQLDKRRSPTKRHGPKR